ncbi:glutamyl-tRNA reductase [Segetibacter sp. 3557_3]|uniref:glutamyl-tRNA reductase n=1 Tax=Segetibacter sp. 3557_3 TaxID=2547429 RepID=UPI001058E6D0|nr:glutamyl-tRNA reductase [Segetibacter sp. 3557_3]TDH26139.1 glutamyl-tRNA reductase [Segetibacter sp. 3557_3]
MTLQTQGNISRFYVAGINYKKTEASIRGQFAVCNDQYPAIAEMANQSGITQFFILSTCNRTEIYGFAEDPSQLIDLLCTRTTGDIDTFRQLSYKKQGLDAVQHLFEVGAGLESQILGDYEIIGQIKCAVKVAKQYGFIGAFLERLVNCVLQSNKNIKNQTALSGGTVSVSFAAVQYIRRYFNNVAGKKILLLGIGKIGRNTCKNLVDYLNKPNITLVNRTQEKAAHLAAELGLSYDAYENLADQVAAADIILVSTNAPEPTILTSFFKGNSPKLVIDLSIPYNVQDGVKCLPGVTLVNVDELSKLKDETLQRRMAEVPKAKAIIALHKAEFLDWCDMRKNAPVINAVKKKLHDMHQCSMFLSTYTKLNTASPAVAGVNQQAIQKVIKNMAVKMRVKKTPGCAYIEAINDFIVTHVN